MGHLISAFAATHICLATVIDGRKEASKQTKREDWTDRRKENRHNFDLLSQGILSIVAGKCGRNHRGLDWSCSICRWEAE